MPTNKDRVFAVYNENGYLWAFRFFESDARMETTQEGREGYTYEELVPASKLGEVQIQADYWKGTTASALEQRDSYASRLGTIRDLCETWAYGDRPETLTAILNQIGLEAWGPDRAVERRGPVVFGMDLARPGSDATAYRCGCGHIAYSAEDHDAHQCASVEEGPLPVVEELCTDKVHSFNTDDAEVCQCGAMYADGTYKQCCVLHDENRCPPGCGWKSHDPRRARDSEEQRPDLTPSPNDAVGRRIARGESCMESMVRGFDEIRDLSGKCPECGAAADRPKCALDLPAGQCPRRLHAQTKQEKP